MTNFGIDRSGAASGTGTPAGAISETIADAKGDLIVGTSADHVARLAVGTDGQRLVADSTQTTGLKYVADTTNYAVTTKGDVLVGTAANTVVRKAVPGTKGYVRMSDPAASDGWTDVAPGSDGKVRMADSSQTSGWQDVPTAFMFKNRLINPDGGVYQRTVAATADDTYFADRWNMLTQTNTVTPSVLTDPETGYPKGVRITQSQAAAQRFGFAQIIEGKNCRDLRGQSGVLVPRVRISNSQAIRYAILGWTSTEDAVTSDVVLDWTNGTFTAGNFFLAANLSVLAVGAQTPSAATWTSLTALTVALGTSFNNIIVMVWTEGTAAQNVTLDFDYVQFERGSVATEFERRLRTAEELLAYRYFVLWPAIVIDVAAAYQTIPFPVEMRANPTLAGGGAGFTVQTADKKVLLASQTGRATNTNMTADAEL